MEQLKKAYEAIEMLQALNLPVSEEQLRGLARLEKTYLQEEIIPLLKQELEPMVEKLKGKFQMDVSFDKENGLSMQIVEQADKRYSLGSRSEDAATRDTTRYSIDGGVPLNKRRFVLTVIKKYVESHPDITYSELKQRFPDALSNSLLHGVFRPYNEIVEKVISQPDLEKRFFLEKDDLIRLSDGTMITVYNQWGSHFPDFLQVANLLHEVESFSNNS